MSARPVKATAAAAAAELRRISDERPELRLDVERDLSAFATAVAWAQHELPRPRSEAARSKLAGRERDAEDTTSEFHEKAGRALERGSTPGERDAPEVHDPYGASNAQRKPSK